MFISVSGSATVGEGGAASWLTFSLEYDAKKPLNHCDEVTLLLTLILRQEFAVDSELAF